MQEKEKGFSLAARCAMAAIVAICGYMVAAPAVCGHDYFDIEQPHFVLLAALVVAGAVLGRELVTALRIKR